MTTSVPFLLVAAGAAFLLGFAADVLARKFGFPDVLWLVLLGILFGPLLKVISFNEVLAFAPYLGIAALSLILYDAGLDMHSQLLGDISWNAVLLATAAVLASTAVILPVAYYFISGRDLIHSILFSAALAPSSSAVVVAVSSRMSLHRTLRSLVHLTSAIEDTIAIIIVTTLLYFLLPGGGIFGSGTPYIYAASSLPIGIVGGALAGLLWVELAARYQSYPYFPMATVGYLFFIVGLVEYLNGAGILSALVMGVVIGNGASIRRWMGQRGYFIVSQRVRQFGSEVAFLLRAFFLFSIGLLLTVNTAFATIFLGGLLVTGAVLGVRVAIVYLYVESTEGSSTSILPLTALSARGLTSAVLLLLPISAGIIAGAEEQRLIEAAIGIIIASTIAMSVGVWYFERKAAEERQRARRRAIAAASLKSQVEAHFGAPFVNPSPRVPNGSPPLPAPEETGHPPLPRRKP